MSELHLEGLCKRFGSRTVLDNVTLTVASGTTLSLLGPSGTGKSTLLRIAAGLLAPDVKVAKITGVAGTPQMGRVLLDGRDVSHLPPEGRGMGMVFQDAALFPHLSVADNVAFGLKMRGMPHQERQRQARHMLERVELAGKAEQRPETLSGGEQQRVALARALVTRPSVLLLDEPFARLDPRLRLDMRRLVQKLRRELGTTMLTVTHDGAEALADGDTVAVLVDGKLMQTGTPQTLYEHPVNEVVARFFGEINILEQTNGRRELFRPDALELVACNTSSCAGNVLANGCVCGVNYAGGYIRAEILVQDQDKENIWIVHAAPAFHWSIGDAVAICGQYSIE